MPEPRPPPDDARSRPRRPSRPRSRPPAVDADDRAQPEPTTDPTRRRAPSIEPGEVNRSSLDLSATYDVNALISVGTRRARDGRADRGHERVRRGHRPPRAEHVAARLGGIEVTESSVDGKPRQGRGSTTRRSSCPSAASCPTARPRRVLIGYRATLRPRPGGLRLDVLERRRDDRDASLDPVGQPSGSRSTARTTATAVRDRLEPERRRRDRHRHADGPRRTRRRRRQARRPGAGQAWAFTVQNVRDVSVVLAPDFGVLEGEVRGRRRSASTRATARFNRDRLLGLAEAAIRADADMLGVDYPWTVLTVVETQGGDALEAPGLIWVPKNLDTLNQTYARPPRRRPPVVLRARRHNQRTEPFADDGMADLLARTATRQLPRRAAARRRASTCAITGYTAGCYYETV